MLLYHWALGLLFCAYLVGFNAYKKGLPKLFILTWGYLITLVTVVICLQKLGFWYTQPEHTIGTYLCTLIKGNWVRQPNGVQSTYLLSTTCFAAWVLSIFGAACSQMDRLKNETVLKWGLALFSILGSLLWLADVRLIPHSSSNATIIILGLPIILSSIAHPIFKGIAFLLVCTSIIKADCSNPMGVAFITLGGYFFYSLQEQRVFSKKKLILGIFRALIPLALGVLYYGPSRIFDDTARFEAYRIFMSWWWADPWSINLFGYGPGTFEILHQPIQAQSKFMMGTDKDGLAHGWLWMHLHSDWLQFIWEYGILGATLIFLCFIKLVKDLPNYYKPIALGAGSTLVFSFDMRYPVLPIVFMLLFGVAYCRHKD